MEEGPSSCNSSRRRRGVFMAFGTKGDVYPIAAIAASFACDQIQYDVYLITNSAHQNLSPHLAAKNVSFLPISTPPVVSAPQGSDDNSECKGVSFSTQKKNITKEHRKECLNLMEMIFEDGWSVEDDFVAINFFALEGWTLAELFHVRCVVAAPYVVPYSAPASFERLFKKNMQPLYKHLRRHSSTNRVCWEDVIHWMWPLFTEEWGLWRSELNLSPCPFTDPITGLPASHDWTQSPLLLYGFSKEVVECPDYWPSNVRVCGFWFVPMQWQFSCNTCRELSVLFSERCLDLKDELCSTHTYLQQFLMGSTSDIPIFIGFSSVGSMGFLRNSQAFLRVLESVMQITSYRFILFTAGYEPLESAIHVLSGASTYPCQKIFCEDGVLLSDRLFCYSGTIPYNWLFQRCALAIHHGGSGSTAAALQSGIPQVICPFLLDQFYWAERMFWLGVAPEPLQKNILFPDKEDDTDIWRAANALSISINSALSPEIKARASKLAERLYLEDGVNEAVTALKEQICVQN